jgi:hypothetical protein
MKKLHPVDVIGAAVTAVVTGTTVARLTDHNVGLLTILAVGLSLLSAGLTLTALIVKAVTTEVYRCSAEGCTVEIRATRNHSPERLAVLRNMATDHGRHGSVGA